MTRSCPPARAACLPLLILIAQLGWIAAAAANPMDAYGLGARAPALGGAYAAVADDTAAAYYNPAALARIRDLRIDLGYQFAQPTLSVSGAPQALMASRGLAAGLAVPGEIFGLRFAFGLTLFLPDQQVTRIRVLSFDHPRLQLYENRAQRLYMAATLALHIYRGLYLGAGLSFMSRSQGTVHLRGRLGVGKPDESALDSAVDVNLLAIRYPQAGLLFEVSRNLSLALVYRHRFLLELEQGFNIHADVGDEGVARLIEGARVDQLSESVDLFQPWQLVAAVAARFATVQVSFDLTYLRWSEQPPPASRFTIAIDVGRFNDLVKLPKAVPFPDPGFHDTLMPAVGIEWRVLSDAFAGRLALDLRAGYRYEPSPIPAQEEDSTFADADRHIVSLGTGIEFRRLFRALPKPFSLDLFAAMSHLPTRRFRKLDPRSLIGDFSLSGQVWQIGTQLRCLF